MPTLGKYIIDNLTVAMYENLHIVYREYIQNSADSIDKAIKSGLITPAEARIDIEISSVNDYISIADNGTGINKADFVKIMSSVADSNKDRSEDKGFRGIGRLGGIASCEILRFSTSVQGEDVISICEWDAKAVQAILVDKNDNPTAEELINRVISFKTEKTKNIAGHFFKVELIEVEPNASDLLDEKTVKEYLGMVAPIPYNGYFFFQEKIKNFASENGFVLDEYNVFVNGDRLFKDYRTKLYAMNSSKKEPYDDIVDVQFEIFRNSKDEILAWMWYGISNFEKQIPTVNTARGIRLRKGNIEIGDEYTLITHKFFDENRGNLYYIGEVFAVHEDLIPNGRRDYFILNPTCREFEQKLNPYFYYKMKTIYHHANEYKKALQKQQQLVNATLEFEKKDKEGAFTSPEAKQKAKENIKELQVKAEEARKKIAVRDTKEKDDTVLTKVYKSLKEKYPVDNEKKAVPSKPANTDEQSGKKNKKDTYLSQSLSNYNNNERKLIGKIYTIIQKVMDPISAEKLVMKIQEELKK